ncbi:MAG: hypothetical protein ACWGQW_03770, partial [bacterium]
SMARTYDEILADLEENAEYELVVSTARRESEDGDVHLALVTVDGVTRGVVTRDSTLEALDLAAERALSYEEEEDEDEDEDRYGDEEDLEESEEGLFDRAVGALEAAVELLRRVRR